MNNDYIMDNDYIVLFDFDNTITKLDVIDDMLEKFSGDNGWVELENRWKAGKIGSRQCLNGQIRGIRITRKELDSYLKRIQIDPYFKKVLSLLRSKKIKAFILSDNFDYILKRVLKSKGLKRVPIFSNRVRLSGGRLIPSFPLSSNTCGGLCGHCKLTSMRRLSGKDKTVVYIGDGRSDICPAKTADVVFAKDALEDYFRSKKMAHIQLRNMNDVYKFFKNPQPRSADAANAPAGSGRSA